MEENNWVSLNLINRVIINIFSIKSFLEFYWNIIISLKIYYLHASMKLFKKLTTFGIRSILRLYGDLSSLLVEFTSLWSIKNELTSLLYIVISCNTFIWCIGCRVCMLCFGFPRENCSSELYVHYLDCNCMLHRCGVVLI